MKNLFLLSILSFSTYSHASGVAPLVPYQGESCLKVLQDNQEWIASVCPEVEFHPMTQVKVMKVYYFGFLTKETETSYLMLNLISPDHSGNISNRIYLNEDMGIWREHTNDDKAFFSTRVILPFNQDYYDVTFNFSKGSRQNDVYHDEFGKNFNVQFSL